MEWTGVLVDVGVLEGLGKSIEEELKQLDKFVRDHTVERFGPVRSVA